MDAIKVWNDIGIATSKVAMSISDTVKSSQFIEQFNNCKLVVNRIDKYTNREIFYLELSSLFDACKFATKYCSSDTFMKKFLDNINLLQSMLKKNENCLDSVASSLQECVVCCETKPQSKFPTNLRVECLHEPMECKTVRNTIKDDTLVFGKKISHGNQTRKNYIPLFCMRYNIVTV